MKDPTNAKRQREWYARKKAGAQWQPLICTSCLATHRGKHGSICCRCWEKTPEGKQVKADRAKKNKKHRKASQLEP
jgi:hypothetical protein